MNTSTSPYPPTYIAIYTDGDPRGYIIKTPTGQRIGHLDGIHNTVAMRTAVMQHAQMNYPGMEYALSESITSTRNAYAYTWASHDAMTFGREIATELIRACEGDADPAVWGPWHAENNGYDTPAPFSEEWLAYDAFLTSACNLARYLVTRYFATL